MKKVLAMGNALVDILIPIEDDGVLKELGFARGSMVLVDKDKMNQVLRLTKTSQITRNTGGSAANMINGLALLGGDTGYIGKVGDDEYGSFFNSDLVRHNICSILLKGKAETGKSVILISRDSERTMATYLGSAIELEAGDLRPEFFSGYDYFHLEGYLVQNYSLVRRSLDLAREAGCKIAVDLASFNVVEENIAFLEEIVDEYIHIVFANEEEARSFTGKDDPGAALVEIASRCELAIVKIGKDGSLVKDGTGEYRIPAISVDALDTTGAGDLYAAGFFYGLARGLRPDVCGKIASITGGHIVEVVGAKMDKEHWKSVRQMIAQLKID